MDNEELSFIESSNDESSSESSSSDQNEDEEFYVNQKCCDSGDDVNVSSAKEATVSPKSSAHVQGYSEIKVENP